MAKSSSAKQQKEGGKAAPVKVKVGKTSAAAANKKKPKIARPIPKSWPVSSHLSYPPPNSTTNTNDNNNDDDESTNEQQTSLKPGKTLQQNCNGCDVFLRKSAVQSTSASIIPTKQNSNSKGAVKRFLIVFPGRMTLKAPPPTAAPTAASAAAVLKEDASKDEMNAGDNDIKKDNNATTNEGKSETTATKPTKRNPFAPANPPQLLGRLVSLGGADQKVELRIPFPSNNNTNKPNDNVKTHKNEQQQPQKQMVMSGRAIPLSGKYMVLSFKRTGGKDSIAASSASTPKNKKMGTGSIACKDIFRSVIVLGESQLVDKNDEKKKVDVGSSGCGEDVRVSHYGGSERTVDGGGKNDASTTGAAAKRKFKSVTAPTSLKETHDGDESSVVDSLGSDSDEEDDNDDIEMKNGSDDEFVPISSKKKQSASVSKKRKSSDSNEDTPVARKRTPRRSAAKAAKVKYVDDDSDVDMSDNDSDKSDDDNSGKSPTVTQEIDDDSDVSSVVEEIVPKKKRAYVAPAASKKRKLSGGSSRNGDADESSCIVIDSDDDDIKTPKLAGKTNGLKKATAYKSAAAKGNAKTVQAAPSSPLKSVSPRRRKKLSPNKPSPKKPVSLDLDDDPFAFL